ncbi:MAG: 2-dehydro-3-deoxyphosphooctonate aldolase [Planctomycetota bacterium]|jgi:2-dehydro-3-deoxyphosphooctonate aldolase (KDO 8-P synthase)
MSAQRPQIQIAGKSFGGTQLFLIAGPCVLESRALSSEVAHALVEICAARGVPLIFKSSFDKANRSSVSAVRGPGLDGLEWLAEIRARHSIPVLTDVHEREQCAPAAEVVDVLQIPAFLCRQTDLLLAAAGTGKAVNIKKGQFLAPWDMQNVTRKCASTGNRNLLVTERGTSFGYGRLIVDMTGFEHLHATGFPVVFDATHSVQQPGGLGDRTGGDRRQVPGLARAAVATGFVDGLFFEVHPDPDKAPSDGPNMVKLAEFPAILDGVLAVHAAVRGATQGAAHTAGAG